MQAAISITTIYTPTDWTIIVSGWQNTGACLFIRDIIRCGSIRLREPWTVLKEK